MQTLNRETLSKITIVDTEHSDAVKSTIAESEQRDTIQDYYCRY